MNDGELIPYTYVSSEMVPAGALAKDDLSAIVAWVASKENSAHTRRAFSLEARRWLAWLIWAKADQPLDRWLDKGTSLDAAVYARFLSTKNMPAMPVTALDRAGLSRQPFKVGKQLSSASKDRAINALKAMYADMIKMRLEGDYAIEKNPFNLFKASSPVDNWSPRKKALTKLERKYVEMALSELQRTGKIVEYQQIKWIWTALLWSAMRRHELAEAVAGDVYQDIDEDGESTWMLHVRGKGNVVASVPLSDEFMDGMREYRVARGHPPLPVGTYEGKDQTPLILPLRGNTRNVHPETINRSVKKLVALASGIALAENDPFAAGRLAGFASHSARHTQVTMIVDATGDITLGQDMARHSSILTTRRYKAPSTSRLKQALKSVSSK